MTLRFNVGEIAIYVGPKINVYSAEIGDELEIVATCIAPGTPLPEPTLCGRPCNAVVPADYCVRYPDGRHAHCDDYKLRKKRPPIPPEVLETFNRVTKPREVEA